MSTGVEGKNRWHRDERMGDQLSFDKEEKARARPWAQMCWKALSGTPQPEHLTE